MRIDKVTTLWACWCWRGRARATCSPRSPTSTSQQGLSLADGAADVDQRGGALGAEGQFRRRARLRNPPPDRNAELRLRPPDGGGGEFGIKPFGIRAMDPCAESPTSCRARVSIEYTALDSGSTVSSISRGRLLGATRSSPGATRAFPIASSPSKSRASRTRTRAAPSRCAWRRLGQAHDFRRLRLANR